MARSSRLLRFGWVGVVVAMLVSVVAVAPVGAAPPSSCEFFENPDGSFEVSWSETAPNAVIVSRTNNGDGPFWRGRVDAPGLSFSDSSSWAAVVGYQIQHQVGGVNSDYIECVEVDPPGAGGGPSSCEFFENPDGSFEVSWDQTVPDAVIVSRTNNGAGPYWRGRVDAPGLSFSDGSSWSSQTTYQIQHQVGGVNSDYIECVEVDPPGAGGGPSSCEFFENPDGSFEVSWDQTVPDAVIVSRTNNGDGPFWRGRVDAPGLSFSDSSSWASVVGYQIQHQVGGVNSDYIDCSMSDEPPAPPTVPTTCEYRAGPASTLSFDIGPDYAAFPEVTSQVIQERLGDGDWVDKASVTAGGTGYAIDRPATSPASYRIDARDGAGETVGVAECGPTVPPNLSPRPFNDAVGGPVSDYLSLDHLTQFEADGVTGSGNRCDIPDGYSLWQWDKPFTMTFPNAQATVQLALWLPAAPEGFHYQVWVDATVSRVPHGPGWAGGSMPYDFGLSDTEGRLQDNTEMGYRGPGEQVFDLERNGWKTEAGFGFSNGGYVRVYFRNYFGSTSGVASTWDLFGPGKYQIYMVPEGTVVDPADRDNYTSIQPQPNPCLGFYAPDEPGLSYPELQISEENTLSWREALGYAWEAASLGEQRGRHLRPWVRLPRGHQERCPLG